MTDDANTDARDRINELANEFRDGLLSAIDQLIAALHDLHSKIEGAGQ